MNKKPMLDRFKPVLMEIIHKYVPNCKVYLFGSRARGTHKEGADIDLALDAQEKISFTTILKIQHDIEETTIPVFVDVVDLDGTSDDFKNEVKRDGILWSD